MNILVTGGSGLVGKHLQDILPDANYISSAQYDLRKREHCCEAIWTYKPDFIVHLAARVGGIADNIAHPAEFLNDNILMSIELFRSAHYINPKIRILSMLSTCIYPDVMAENLYPMDESMIHLGPPQESNKSYAVAKRVLHTITEAYNTEYGTRHGCLIPCNLYGEYDHFELQRSHFVSALLKRIHDAKVKGDSKIVLWGTGKPLRQFMHAADLARAIKVYLRHDLNGVYNIATPEIKSIREIAEIALLACDATNLQIEFDETKPDGQFRKDVTAMKWELVFPSMSYTSLLDGIRRTYNGKFNV